MTLWWPKVAPIPAIKSVFLNHTERLYLITLFSAPMRLLATFIRAPGRSSRESSMKKKVSLSWCYLIGQCVVNSIYIMANRINIKKTKKNSGNWMFLIGSLIAPPVTSFFYFSSSTKIFFQEGGKEALRSRELSNQSQSICMTHYDSFWLIMIHYDWRKP